MGCVLVCFEYYGVMSEMCVYLFKIEFVVY